MYIMPDMIEMTEVQFQSDDHKQVAINLGMCNPNVTTLDLLTEIAEKVNKVPMERIRKITYPEMVKEFELPNVWGI